MKFIKFIFVILCCLSVLNITAFAENLPNDVINYVIKAGETTSARIEVENNDNKAHTFSLKFSQLPQNFNGYFLVDGKTATGIDVAASQKGIIQFCIDTPATPAVTEVYASLQILRDDGIEQNIYVSYTLNQDYALKITNDIKSIKAVSGDTVRLEIGVTNTGSKELMNLAPQVNTPYKWIIEKTDPALLNLKPNESGIFVFDIIIPSSQQAGEYPVSVTCSNPEIKSNEVSVPVTVLTSANYFWWIAGGIAVLAVFTIFFFIKHGRR